MIKCKCRLRNSERRLYAALRHIPCAGMPLNSEHSQWRRKFWIEGLFFCVSGKLWRKLALLQPNSYWLVVESMIELHFFMYYESRLCVLALFWDICEWNSRIISATSATFFPYDNTMIWLLLRPLNYCMSTIISGPILHNARRYCQLQ